MKIHPLFEEVLTRAIVPSTIRSAWDDWVAAGKPVLVEEAAPLHDLRWTDDVNTALRTKITELERDLKVSQFNFNETLKELATKDARIKELERANQELREELFPGTYGPRSKIRNDALEEAALEAQKAFDEAFGNRFPGVPIRTLEDRIRSLKK